MRTTLREHGAVQIEVYGVGPCETIAELQACADALGCNFILSTQAEQHRRRRSSLIPIELGTFQVKPGSLSAVISCLIRLAKKRQQEPFCSEVEGCPLDLSPSPSAIQRQITRLIRRAGTPPPLLDVTKATSINRTFTSAAAGPHHLEVTM